jgi:hypothetical protein
VRLNWLVKLSWLVTQAHFNSFMEIETPGHSDCQFDLVFSACTLEPKWLLESVDDAV